MEKDHFIRRLSWLLLIMLAAFILTALTGQKAVTEAQEIIQRRVNAPYFGDGPVLADDSAIFWLGEVREQSNYADVRLGYNDEMLSVIFHVFDKWLWMDKSPDPADMENWDAVSLYLQLEGNDGAAPTTNAYRFILQLDESSDWAAQPDFQAAYRWQDNEWQPVALDFETKTSWRGDYPNTTIADSGWLGRFYIPFAVFGLAEAPASGSVWGMAIAVHDRDDENGNAIPDQTWPDGLNPNQPSTWGQLHFGEFTYAVPQAAVAGGEVTVQHGLNGAVVTDAHVGGGALCGTEHAGHYFSTWGDYNRAGDGQINIQNQWDVSDFPCFSKYYVTFPLDSLPPDKMIISATLTMNHFGGAGYADSTPPVSLIQVSRVAEAWNEETITWNNAPLAAENVAAATIDVLGSYPGWPGIERRWDVSGLVAVAYDAGEPARLTLYSADGAYHSGKYFFSSDAGMEGRPKLEITWGDPVSQENETQLYLPLVTQP